MAALRPRDVKLLTVIVKRHCEINGIMSDEGRESVAASAVRFYESGIMEGSEILRLLDSEDDPDARRYG